jgi:hypothetical protein
MERYRNQTLTALSIVQVIATVLPHFSLNANCCVLVGPRDQYCSCDTTLWVLCPTHSKIWLIGGSHSKSVSAPCPIIISRSLAGFFSGQDDDFDQASSRDDVACVPGYTLSRSREIHSHCWVRISRAFGSHFELIISSDLGSEYFSRSYWKFGQNNVAENDEAIFSICHIWSRDVIDDVAR